MMCWRITALLMLALAASSVPPANARSDYDVCKIKDFMAPVGNMQARPADLTLISAHRGLWRDYPENTVEAIEAAIAADIETVELDVRLSRDLHPVLMHDWALDRTTTGTGFVADHDVAEITQLWRRDRLGKDTKIRVPALEAALEHLAQTNRPLGSCQRGYVLVLDVKDRHDARAVTSYEAAKATWRTIMEFQERRKPVINLAQAIMMKVLATELPNDREQINKDFPDIGGESPHLIPIIYYNSPKGDKIFDGYFYSRPNYIVTFEVVLPYPGIAHATKWDFKLAQYGWLRTGFAPWDDYPEGTSRGTGVCCNLRVPSATAKDPNFTGNWEYLAARGMNMMTSDRPDILQDYLRRLGRRNLDHIGVGGGR